MSHSLLSRSGSAVSLLALALSVCACSGGAPSAQPPGGEEQEQSEERDPVSHDEVSDFLLDSTISRRVSLPLSAPGAMLSATALAHQLSGYDPGSLLRCQLEGEASYRAAVDALGGVRWGYSVGVLEDLSKPRLLLGFRAYDATALPGAPTAANDAAAPAVEIVQPDIVAVTDSAALFYSRSHGLMLVSIAGGQPSFQCATPLPGNVDQFFYRDGHLVAMTQAPGTRRSALLHFGVSGTQLRFIESVDLGQVSILDSRRFNDQLVFYTDLTLAPQPVAQASPSGGAPIADRVAPPPTAAAVSHRALRVFQLGDTLQERMNDTLLDTTASDEQLWAGIPPETPVDTLLHEAQRFGRAMWASDHYFVVTRELDQTYLAGWKTQQYSVCTASHVVETPYQHCWTEYEARPNPDYTPPDNSGGDRACQGATLSECLVSVARVANRTIQVPVAQRCEQRTRSQWYCDAHELRTTSYPELRREQATRLFIYEYTDAGFVRVDDTVHEITTPGLAAASPDAQIDTLTTSSEAFELEVPGQLQSAHFQNGYLYAISQGVLQVYALGGGSLVRTATLPVVNESLQATLFSGQRLYLSDFGWSSGDHSTLRVVNLANPAFPSVEASTHSLPGGHRSILASEYGIFTVGSVSQFQGQAVNRIKLGLFTDPFVEEQAYLILGSDLSGARLAPEENQLFDAAAQRALITYSGQNEASHAVQRLGLSRLTPGQIVSEGAVELPEQPQRVRALGAGSYLSFANSSIEWLTPREQEWQSSPVLGYFQPSAVYRVNDADDYVEVQRLGNRCQLYFTNAADINLRSEGAYSERFECFDSGFLAYGNFLIFGQQGVEFNFGDRSARELGAEEVDSIRALITQREVCLFSLDALPNNQLDYRQLPTGKDPICMSQDEFNRRQNELNDRGLRP